MSSDEEQKTPKNFPKASYVSSSKFQAGFGFSGPSDAWLKARGYKKQAPSGSLDQELRQKILEKYESGTPSYQVSSEAEKSLHKKPQLTSDQINQKKELLAKREKGLSMTKKHLQEAEAPQEKLCLPVQSSPQKRELLTKWIKPTQEEPTNKVEVPVGLGIDFSEGDLKVTVDSGESLMLHSAVLAARCGVFRSMLLSCMQEARSSQITLSGYSFGAVKSFFSYLYSGKLLTDNESILELLSLSNLYNMQGLKLLIQFELEKMIDEENLSTVLEVSEENEAVELSQACLEFCRSNYHSLRKAGKLPPKFKNLVA